MSSSRSRAARPLVALGLASSVLLGVAGCGSDAGPGSGGVQVQAAFEPLAWVAEEVGGPDVDVVDLTPSGTEPHDLELSPKDVARLQGADLVVLLEGFQPAVDDAAAGGSGSVLDARAVAVDDDGAEPVGGGAEDDHAEDDHAEAGDDGHGHEEGGDPHVWLDPTRLARIATAVGDQLAELDPEEADGYRSRAADLVERLEALDAELAAGLADCEVDTLVTSHEAFGWFAARYGFEQVGIAGISPDREPSPADLARVADLVEDRGVTTVYTEALVDPAVSRTVAEEAGVDTAVLDPVESITDASPGDDYLAVMRANLATLREGQRCP